MNTPTVPTSTVDNATLPEANTSEAITLSDDLAEAIRLGRLAYNGEHAGQQREALFDLVTLLEQNTQIPGLFANELSTQLTGAIVALDQAIQGNGDIVGSAVALVEFLQENARPHGSESVALADLPIEQAKAALVGDSNDAEHDALFAFMGALGFEIPECTCNAGGDVRHAADCPSHDWQKGGE